MEDITVDLRKLSSGELIQLGIECDEQIRELSKRRIQICNALDVRFAAKSQTEYMRCTSLAMAEKGLVARRAVTHTFRFAPEGIPMLRQHYGNLAEQLVVASTLTPTERFRAMLLRADDEISVALRTYITVEQTLSFTFHAE